MNALKTTIRRAALVVGLVLITHQVSADCLDVKRIDDHCTVELERERLASLIDDIDHMLKRLPAAAHAAPDTRLRFDYGALEDDLHRVRAAIARHIGQSFKTPRTLSPLTATYTEVTE